MLAGPAVAEDSQTSKSDCDGADEAVIEMRVRERALRVMTGRLRCWVVVDSIELVRYSLAAGRANNRLVVG